MIPLALFVAVGLGASAWFKAWTTTRLGMGLSPWVIMEVVTALALLSMLFPGSFVGDTFARWSVALAIMVMLAAMLDHGCRLKKRRHHRALTEGGRLAAYVQYQGQRV